MKLTIERKNQIWKLTYKDGVDKTKETVKTSELLKSVIDLIKSEIANDN